MNEIAAKAESMKKWLTVGGIAIVGLIVSPIIFLTIKGLVGLAIAGAVGFTMVSFAPWFALKIANWKYRAIEAEKVSHIKKVNEHARENPIETLTNLLNQKKQAFVTFKENVENSIAARNQFEEKCKAFAKRYPARAAEFQKQLERMTLLVQKKLEALKDAQDQLEVGYHKLEEMKAYWEMSQAAQELNKAAGMDTGDAFERMKADTSCDAVFESVSRAFSQLEVAAALEEDKDEFKSGIEYNQPVVLETQTVNSKIKVTV